MKDPSVWLQVKFEDITRSKDSEQMWNANVSVQWLMQPILSVIPNGEENRIFLEG